MTSRQPGDRPDAAHVEAALSEPIVDATEPMVVVATELSPTATVSTRLATTRKLSGGQRRAARWIVLGLGTLVGAVLIARAGDDDAPFSPSTTAVASTTTPPTTVAPATAPPAQPVVDCAALEAEKADLAARKREIMKQYKDDHETRDRLRDEVDARTQEVDAQLQAHC
jgi:hypothetical protein